MAVVSDDAAARMDCTAASCVQARPAPSRSAVNWSGLGTACTSRSLLCTCGRGVPGRCGHLVWPPGGSAFTARGRFGLLRVGSGLDARCSQPGVVGFAGRVGGVGDLPFAGAGAESFACLTLELGGQAAAQVLGAR